LSCKVYSVKGETDNQYLDYYWQIIIHDYTSNKNYLVGQSATIDQVNSHCPQEKRKPRPIDNYLVGFSFT
jgi:hypothetical protein